MYASLRKHPFLLVLRRRGRFARSSSARNVPIAASYPDVSLLVKMCAQRKAGRSLYPSHGPLRFITSHSFRARLCHAKNEAPEEEAVPIGEERGEADAEFRRLGVRLLILQFLSLTKMLFSTPIFILGL